MSWAAHEFETYVIQKHFGLRMSYLGIVAGTYAPDAFTKWYVYGVDKGPISFGAGNPVQFHRGWPGAGFTHSILFCDLLSLAVFLVARSRGWGLGVLAGSLAHVVTDTSDTVGSMLFFPWTQHFTTGLWKYAAEAGRYDDAAAYYSSFGLLMDVVWLAIALVGWRVFTAHYFRTVIVPADGVWRWLGARCSEQAMLVFYRTSLFYGVTRLVFWTGWAHVLNAYPWDLSYGGPYWIEGVRL